MRLIGRKGTIDVLDTGRLQITYANGDKKVVPIKELSQYIGELEIVSTEDGGIKLGEW